MYRSFVRIIAVAFASFVLTPGSMAVGQTPSLTPIRVISAASDDLRPLLYAQKEGLFRRAGLDVTLALASTGALTTQAVIAGEMDVGKSSLAPLVTAHARGLPLVLIAPSLMYSAKKRTSALVVAPRSPIRSPLDLQGKVIGATALGDITSLGLRAIIDGLGGDSSTLRWVELPTSAVTAAIDQGRIDAGLVAEPSLSQDIKTGKIRFLVDMLGPGGYPRPILETAYYAMREYVEKNHDVVRRFAGVLMQAAAYSNSHEAETVPLYAAFAHLDPQVAAQMHHTISATRFDPGEIQPVIDLAAKYGTIPHVFDARDFIAQ